jgi:hypothetical protein
MSCSTSERLFKSGRCFGSARSWVHNNMIPYFSTYSTWKSSGCIPLPFEIGSWIFSWQPPCMQWKKDYETHTEYSAYHPAAGSSLKGFSVAFRVHFPVVTRLFQQLSMPPSGCIRVLSCTSHSNQVSTCFQKFPLEKQALCQSKGH